MIDPLSIVRADAQAAIAVALFAVSVVRGAAPERWLSTALLVSLLIDWEWQSLSPAPGPMPEVTLAHMLLDVPLLAVIVCVAVSANRLYPLWMGGAQIGALATHIVPVAMKDFTPLAYALMNRLPLYVELMALAIGLAFHIIRVREGSESYPEWRQQLR